MDELCDYSEEELLRIHAKAERLDRRRRVWYTRLAVGVAVAVLATFVTAFGAIVSGIQGGTQYDLIWRIGMVGIGVAVVVCIPIGALHGKAERSLNRFCVASQVEQLRPSPSPQMGERFGRDRVFVSDEGLLQLISLKVVRAEGFWRLICFVVVVLMAILTIVGSVIGGSVAGVAIGLLSSVFIGAVGWTLIPLATEWAITRRHGQLLLDIRTVRWFVLRGALAISAADVTGFSYRDGDLLLIHHGGRHVRLTYMEPGILERWKVRRLVAAICDQLAIPRIEIEVLEGKRLTYVMSLEP